MMTHTSRCLALFCALTLATSCSDDSAKPNAPADLGTTRDMRSQPDLSAPKDQGQPDLTGPRDMAQAKDMASEQDMPPAKDMSSPQDMATTPDQGAEMSPPADMSVTPDMPPAPTRPPGQCKVSADCGSAELTCERSAVGGTCLGPCAACDAIPGPDTYSCRVGACVRDCEKDEDCALGRTCSRNLCVVQRCTNNVCPTPQFACSAPDGICVRASCAQGQSCPAGTTCDRGLCMEP